MAQKTFIQYEHKGAVVTSELADLNPLSTDPEWVKVLLTDEPYEYRMVHVTQIVR